MRLCFVYVFAFFFANSAFTDGMRPNSCPIPRLKNGRIKTRQRGRMLKFICNGGYMIAGDRDAYCIKGQWDMPTPKCVRPTCPKKETPPVNGVLYASHAGAVLNINCKPGFDIKGSSVIYCDGTTWDNPLPTCLPGNSKPKLFCDFEDADLCHWTHDLNHDMDWRRDHYSTPTGYSVATGPSHDHTNGEGGNGYYMYIEASSRRVNDTARLISPIFNATNTNTCLEFWYHMYGKTTGFLNAYIKKVSQPWPLTPEYRVFTKSGNLGNVWLREFINLGIVGEDYQIIMEGVRGNGYLGDTAIDDIKIIENCVYEDHIYTTEAPLLNTETPKPVESCENRCGHKADPNDTFQYVMCDCDDLCYENARCCPDLFDFCFYGSSTIIETTTEVLEERQLAEITNSPLKNTNLTNSEVPFTTTIISHPKTETTSKIVPTIRTILEPITTTTKQPTIKPQTIIIKSITSKPKPPPRPPTLRPLIILKAPTTPMIYLKTLPTIPRVLPAQNTSNITFIKPIKPILNDSINDVIEVPKHEDDDEELIDNIDSTSTGKDKSQELLQKKEAYVEKISNRKEYNSYFPENLGKIHTEFSQSQKEVSNVKMIFVIIAAVCGVALLSIVSALVLIKYRVVSCHSKRMSGNGDSQSDVRFLTADEVLDFSLDKEYDEL